MPSKKFAEQNGNSCAAHCTAIAVNEVLKAGLTQDFAENELWPAIKFVDQGGASKMLAEEGNSDPRRIVREIEKRWPGIKPKLMCDGAQKTSAMNFVAEGKKPGLDALFKLLANDAANAPLQLDGFVFYNCSYTMHSDPIPTSENFTGLHNILVEYESGKCYFYNPNEKTPEWRMTDRWKQLENQNGGESSYVFTGVSVAIF